MNTLCLTIIKNNTFKLCFCLFLAVCMQIPVNAFSEKDTDVGKTLIIYYSRTGKTKLISETLSKSINADLLEIKDPKDRSGSWGYMKSAVDAFRHVHTPIDGNPDIAPYSTIVIATPIWSWNVSTPIHTLFEKNRFDGKRLILITTANIHIMKYEKFGEDASFIKRFLRDYLRGKREAAVNEVINSGGEFIGHYHFETKNKTDQEILELTLQCVDYVKGKLS